MSAPRKSSLLIVFLVVFIDLLGFGIVLPLLPRYGDYFRADRFTLGALMAAQLFEALRAALPEIEEQIGRGEFAPLLAWLRASIHEQGSLLDTQALLTRLTGRPLDPQPFLDHLRGRYLA